MKLKDLTFSFVVIISHCHFSLRILASLSTASSDAYPTVNLTSATFLTRRRSIYRNSNSIITISSFFKTLEFECLFSKPVQWIFEYPPMQDPHIETVTIKRQRLTKASSGKSSFVFKTIITLVFRDSSGQVNAFGCEVLGRSSLYLRTVVHAIQKPLFKTELNIHPGSIIPIFEKYGLNPNCAISLGVYVNDQNLECLDKTENTHFEPKLFFCKTSDECNSLYFNQQEQNSCAEEISPTSTLKELQSQDELTLIVCAVGNRSLAFAQPPFRNRNLNPFQTSNSTYFLNLTFHFWQPIDDNQVNDALSFSASSPSHSAQNESGSVIVQEGTQLEITCEGSSYELAHGFQWSIITQLTTGSSKIVKNLVPGDESWDQKYAKTGMIGSVMSLSFPQAGEKHTITCRAPVWKSENSPWVVARVSFIVVPGLKENRNKTGIAPQVLGKMNETIIVTDEKFTLNCEAMSNGTLPLTFEWFWSELKITENFSQWYFMEKGLTYSRLQASDDAISEIPNLLCIVNHVLIKCIIGNEWGKATKLFFLTKDGSVTVDEYEYQRKLQLGAVGAGAIVVVALTTVLVFAWRKVRRQKHLLRDLTESEIEEFHNGNPDAGNAMILPYNMEYEIPKDDLIIDSIILGQGHFGVVTKGSVKQTPVAVKTIKRTAEMFYFKALLSELKVMISVGKHANLVNLVGACTHNIKKREVLIVTEFCANGNLLRFIRNNKSGFIDYFDENRLRVKETTGRDRKRATGMELTVYGVANLSSRDLLRWSSEIANGMDYLTSKHVIHGDLAARNVLLTDRLQAKVGDFGLAKQLFEYSIYVHKLQSPLPLKWMPPESLEDLEFSEASDIWAYGVTLWEIFTLGETPYTGRQWGFESSNILKSGFRLEKPTYANQTIYNTMKECWNLGPSERPKFHSLRSYFLQALCKA